MRTHPPKPDPDAEIVTVTPGGALSIASWSDLGLFMDPRRADRRSRVFTGCRQVYMACEERLKDTGLLGDVNAPRPPFFDEWRLLWSSVCEMERQYQVTRLRTAKKAGRR